MPILQGGSFNWTPPQNHKLFETIESKNFLDSNFFSFGHPPQTTKSKKFVHSNFFSIGPSPQTTESKNFLD